MADSVVEQYYLENKTAGHSKFYEITVVARLGGWHVDLRHGRIGANGRTMRSKHIFSNRNSAIYRASEIKKAKVRDKGYKEVKKTTDTAKKKTTKKKEEPKTMGSIRLNRFSNILD